MPRKPRPPRKLALERETLKKLDHGTLAKVAGGRPNSGKLCRTSITTV